MIDKIRENLLIEDKKEESFYKFLKFKEALDDYRFELKLFNDNKEWNFKQGVTREMLNNVCIARSRTRKALDNIKRVQEKIKQTDFIDELELAVSTFKDSINDELSITLEFLKKTVSEKEFRNLIQLYELTAL